jgi:cobalt-zinc-cadmium efflux system membrane fusion protein
MMSRRLIVAASMLLMLAQACTQNQENKRTAPAQTGARRDTALINAVSVKIGGFELDTIRTATWNDVWTAPARITLDPSTTERLGSIVEGRVVAVYVSPGDRVKAGQVLVAIHSHEIMDARAALGRAKATVAHAESQVRLETTASERAERLLEIRAMSVADVERARAERVNAQTQLDAARFELERAEGFLQHLVGEGALPSDYDPHWVLIRAPINGTVVNRQVQPGAVVLMGADLLTVSNTSTLTLIANLPEGAPSSVREGSEVRFRVQAYGDTPFRARVIRILPSMDSVTRTVAVHATVISESTRPLQPETFADAIIDGAAGSRAVTAPVDALQSIDNVPVLIVGARRGDEMFLEAVPVRVGRRTAERVEIVAGADSGTAIVVKGAAIARAELIKRRGTN